MPDDDLSAYDAFPALRFDRPSEGVLGITLDGPGLNAVGPDAHAQLADYGATPTLERVVERGRIITAAGVSSGIDMALLLAARLCGEDVAQGIQLLIEYDPQPPFDAGSPAKAPAHVLEAVTAGLRTRTDLLLGS